MSSAAENNRTDWYILRGREQSGPHPLSLVRDAARGGSLSKYDLVWKPGWDDWRDAGSVDGLFDPPEIALEMPSGGAPPVPTDATPAAPEPVFAPPPPVGKPARANANYLVRHWRGELSLPMAYWVNGIASNFVAHTIVNVSDFVTDHSDLTAGQYVAVVLAPNVADLVIIGWLAVGIWRSASRHKSRGGWVFWAWLAKSMVILTAAVDIALFAVVSFPVISDGVRIALGYDQSSEYAFRLLRDGTELEFSGEIEIGTARAFAQALDAAPQVKVLHLNSNGGKLDEADRIAAKVARRKLVTYVSDECVSACPLIFLAGRERWIGDRGKLGFHRPYYSGLVDFDRFGISSQEGKYLRSFGVPENFVAKVLSTPGSSMWYPSGEDLARAHVISGVAERGRFADSGELADLAEILLQVPTYASLKQADPKLFEVFMDAVLQERQDGDGAKEILSSAGELFGEVIDRLLPHAPDPLVLERTSIYLGYMDELKSVDPESCAALAGGNDAELKADLNKQFPELSKRENTFRQSLIVSTDPDRPVPTKSEVEPHLTEVFTNIRDRFGDDANLLGKDTLESDEYGRFCEVTIGLYREITRLPGPRAADLLRYLYNER
jgi:GYF domain 2